MKEKNETLIKYLLPASKPTKTLTKVAQHVEEAKFLSNWNEIQHDGWKMHCTKEKYDWCGIWQTWGCLNKNMHEMFGHGQTDYIRHYQRSCYRASCKECYLKWIARAANRATRRMEKYSKRKPVHLMLMVPPSQSHLPYDLLRKKMTKILDIAQWEGGAVVYHPFKFNKIAPREWYVAPHFHLVGFGNPEKIKKAYGMHGWYVKLREERESTFQTFCYMLSHCGIKKNHHAVTWVGELSYSKVISEKEPKIRGCPYCWCPLKPVWYDGINPKLPQEQYFEGLLEHDDHWHYVETQKMKSDKVVVPEYLLNEYLFDYEDNMQCMVLSKVIKLERCYICGNDQIGTPHPVGSQYQLIECKPIEITLWNGIKKNVCPSCYKITSNFIYVIKNNF